jgi:hypothetical protein
MPSQGEQELASMPPKHRDWMIKHVKMLEKNGFIRKNPSRRWPLPVLIALKPGKRDEFRMTADCRYANSQVQPVAGFLPILEMNFQHLEKAAWFSSLDSFKKFRQFTLAQESQEVYSFLTELGVFTPTRLIQGSTDSAHAFQAGIMEVFDDMLYICVLIWIYDVLVYTRSFEDPLTRLDEIFQRHRKFNVKLNPQKIEKFLLKVSSSIQR